MLRGYRPDMNSKEATKNTLQFCWKVKAPVQSGLTV